MYKVPIFFLALFVIAPAWAQVQPAATGDQGPVEDQDAMTTPRLVTGELYPNVTGGEDRTNYVAGILRVEGAYTDNVLPTITATPIGDSTITVLPSFTFNRKTVRVKEDFTYDPAVTFYKNTSGLNAIDQSASDTFEGRLSPHIALGAQEFFVRTSNVFNTPYPFTAGGLGGASQTPASALVVPFAEQIRNIANVDAAFQFSRNSMIGGEATSAVYRFPNRSQVPGIYDSNGEGGSAFYNRRLSHNQYMGLMYEYNKVIADPADLRVHSQMNTLLPFYTITLNEKFALTAAAGAQRADVEQSLHPPVFRSWSPAVAVSFGWQGSRTYLASDSLWTVIAGEGLLGAYRTKSTSLSGGWKFTRTWEVASSFAYETTSVVSPYILNMTNPGGNSLGATALLHHSFGESVSVECGYDRLHEQYDGLVVISQNPDSDRGFVRVTYSFTKSLGR